MSSRSNPNNKTKFSEFTKIVIHFSIYPYNLLPPLNLKLTPLTITIRNNILLPLLHPKLHLPYISILLCDPYLSNPSNLNLFLKWLIFPNPANNLTLSLICIHELKPRDSLSMLLAMDIQANYSLISIQDFKCCHCTIILMFENKHVFLRRRGLF